MPPKNKATKAQSSRLTHPSTRQSTANSNNVPSVYADMLIEAAKEEEQAFASSPRPVKRQRTNKLSIEDVESPAPLQYSTPKHEPEPLLESQETTEEQPRTQHIIVDDFEDSDDSDESDVEFEDVDLGLNDDPPASEDDEPEQKTIQIDLNKAADTTPKRSVPRRQPVTKAEREFRLDVHKWHVMSLLVHGLERNQWCDDEVVHASLKGIVPKKTISLLHVDDSQPSYQRNHSFNTGIEDLCTIWRQTWTNTVRGLRRAHWREGIDSQKEFDEAEDPVDLDDFRSAAHMREGSRDLGAQLFTALLRALALDARLVFSLQALPFSGVAKGQTPEKPKSTYINAPSQLYGSSRSEMPRRRKFKDSPYPVFWTEVLNPTTSLWVPLDPLVRNSVNKPKTQFEPPASDGLNQMSYVLAYEDDATIRDVTRRYTQWYNAKTRRSRIEITKHGVEWWQKAITVFERRMPLPRDELEDQYLAQRNAMEGMPKNVQDFKGHPVYVLERHLRANEVIHPKREVGKFSVGSGKHAKLESVYRAQDCFACRSADAWYRRGRDVKIGEQPLKRVIPKAKRGARGLDVEEDDEEEVAEDVALYAEFQTSLYQPPPVEQGRIPKNAYGNLDLYTSNMIPAGGVHVQHPLAVQAARVLEIDYAEAVTGFTFRGRQGTAVVNGVVVASPYTAAMVATIEGLEWLGTQEVQAARRKIILGIWKRMLTALRVHERIEAEYGDEANGHVGKVSRHGNNDDNDDNDDDDDDENDDDNGSIYEDDQVEEGGGGFMLEADENEEKVQEQSANLQALKSNLPTILPDEVVQQQVKVTLSPHKSLLSESSDETETMRKNATAEGADEDDDIFGDEEHPVLHSEFISPMIKDDSEGGGGFISETAEQQTTHATASEDYFSNNNDGGGGGFMPEEAMDTVGGGFLLEGEDEVEAKGQAKEVSIEMRNHNKDEHPRVSSKVDNDITNIHDGEAGRSTLDTKPTSRSPQQDLNPSSQSNNDNSNGLTGSPTEPSARNASMKDGESEAAADGNISETSLLSHDPDEDNDDPEWLDDALESD